MNVDDNFEKWYSENETRFHQGQFTDKQIAYAAYTSFLSQFKDHTQEIEGWVSVPDIRNKLGSVTHLISMVEIDEVVLAKDALPEAKRSVNYLIQREFYLVGITLFCRFASVNNHKNKKNGNFKTKITRLTRSFKKQKHISKRIFINVPRNLPTNKKIAKCLKS